MKKLFTILCAVMLTFSLSAQQFGAKAGLDLTTFNVTLSDNHMSEILLDGGGMFSESDINTLYDFGMGMGYSVGAYGIFELSDVITLKPELLYAHRTATATLNMDLSPLTSGAFSGDIVMEQTLSFDHIEIPIVFGYLASEEFSINAGPYISMILSGKMKRSTTYPSDFAAAAGVPDTETEENDDLEDFSTIEFGLSVGASYTLNEIIVIDVRYALGLSDLENTDELTAKPSAIRISFGYTFGGGYY